MTESLIACDYCDLLQKIPSLEPNQTAKCARCGSILYRSKKDSLNRTLSFTLAGLIFFILANSFPLISLDIQGRTQTSRLITGCVDLYRHGMLSLAALVFATSILMPFLKFIGTAYIFMPLKFSRLTWKTKPIFKILKTIHPWGMIEIYLLGIFVAYVKLSDMATINIGIAAYAFIASILFMVAADASWDPYETWNKLEKNHE